MGVNTIINWKFNETTSPEVDDNKYGYRRTIDYKANTIVGDLGVVKQEYNKF